LLREPRVTACLLAGALIALAACFCAPAQAADAPAGTVIINSARVQFVVGGSNFSQTATAYITVAQLLNVTVTWQNSTDVSVMPGGVQQSLLFQVTNTGNGPDSFTLGDSLVTPGGASFSPANCQIYFDTAGTGIYAATDQLYTSGSNDPSLAQNGAVNMLVVCNIPNSAADLSLGEMNLAATSKTDSGAPGTVKTGGGVGGVDAIVGLTGAKGNSTGIYQAHNIVLSYVKSQSVSGPSGSLPVSGATIQYTLTVTPSGSATADGVVVSDPVPANTTFVPGSILLNGTAVGPSVGDYNVTAPGAVTVKLGNVAGSGSAQVVQFQVKIN